MTTENDRDPANDLSPMERLELTVSGMTCSHCAATVRRALAECSGVLSADVDLQRGRAVIAGDHLDSDQLVATVAQLGYASRVADT